MGERVELSKRTVAWIFITASGVMSFVLMQSSDMSPAVRLVCAWYTLIVAFLLFAVVGITLSAKFSQYGRLDSPYGWLLRMFYLW